MSILFEVEIPGRVFIKKNQQRVVGHGRGRHVIYSQKYQIWARDAMIYMAREKHKFNIPITLPCEAYFEFHFKDRQAEPDTSNCIEGPQDLLQTMGIVANDKLFVSLKAKKFITGKPKTIIRILSLADSSEDSAQPIDLPLGKQSR